MKTLLPKVVANLVLVVAGFCYGADVATQPSPPSTQPATAPATQPAHVFKTLLEIALKIPADIVPPDAYHWTDLKMGLANEALQKVVVGQPCTLPVTVQTVYQQGSQWVVQGTTISIGAQQAVILVLCPLERARDAATLNPGDKLFVSATIRDAHLSATDPTYSLSTYSAPVRAPRTYTQAIFTVKIGGDITITRNGKVVHEVGDQPATQPAKP